MCDCVRARECECVSVDNSMSDSLLYKTFPLY